MQQSTTTPTNLRAGGINAERGQVILASGQRVALTDEQIDALFLVVLTKRTERNG